MGFFGCFVGGFVFYSDDFYYPVVYSDIRKWLIGRGGRAVECTGLENRRPLNGAREFESHPLRRPLKTRIKQDEAFLVYQAKYYGDGLFICLVSDETSARSCFSGRAKPYL